MTRKAKQKIDYTLSTFAVEGLKPSREAIKLYQKMDEGKISLADTLRQIERNHGVEGGKSIRLDFGTISKIAPTLRC